MPKMKHSLWYILPGIVRLKCNMIFDPDMELSFNRNYHTEIGHY